MAKEAGYDLASGAAMDYAEHKRTYNGFLALVKYGSIAVIAILIFMLVALIGGGGFFGGLIAAFVFAAIATYVMMTADSHSMKH